MSLDLEAIKKRCAAALCRDCGGDGFHVIDSFGLQRSCELCGGHEDSAGFGIDDLEIAVAVIRTDVPALVAEVDLLKAALTEARNAILKEGLARIEAEKWLAVEREDVAKSGLALNAAGWAFIEAYQTETKEVMSPALWNNVKPILRKAFAAFFTEIDARRAAEKASPP